MEGVVNIEEKYMREIILEMFRDKQYFYAKVVGKSMMPTIEKDSIIMIKTGCKDIVIGDVIAFINKDHITVHRVIDNLSQQEYVTKGDNSIEEERVANQNVIGKVIKLNCKGSENIFLDL